ncbi:hypothetical protein BDZ97DRAFT_1127830 [Flammula alnicola]|nr:hypothetical protein BDZ97DRAFT_1127830 [Flammula alnicola]
MAQSVATCPPVFDWTRNAQNLDPCAVASSLINICDTSNNSTALPTIHKGETYPPPSGQSQNACTCSSAVYTLVSACSLCQNADYLTWHDWSSNCLQVYTPGFARTAQVSIPQWAAVFDARVQPVFDPGLARSIAEAPTTSTTSTPTLSITTSQTPTLSSQSTDSQSTAIVTSSRATATSDSATTTSPSTSVTKPPISAPVSPSNAAYSTDAAQGPSVFDASQPSATSQSSQSISGAAKKENNTGAVAGGTVGGIIILAILGGLLFWWIRRRRRARTAPSAAYIAAYGTGRPPTNMSHRALQERSNSLLVSQGNSNSNSAYHDDEIPSSTYPMNPQPHYTSIARDSSLGVPL